MAEKSNPGWSVLAQIPGTAFLVLAYLTLLGLAGPFWSERCLAALLAASIRRRIGVFHTAMSLPRWGSPPVHSRHSPPMIVLLAVLVGAHPLGLILESEHNAHLLDLR